MNRRTPLFAVAGMLLFCSATVASSDPLPRRGVIGLGFQPDPAGGLAIAQVRAGGPGDKAGIKVGDRLLAVNDATPANSQEVVEVFRKSPGGQTVNLKIVRDGAEQTIPVLLDTAGTESLASSTVTYSSVEVPDGYRLRTIITEPKNAKGQVPGFLFVQGLMCSSIDRPQNLEASDTRLVHAMADAGYVTLRVDKPGLGDSGGPPCGDIDFETELEGYKAALEQLATLPSVDPDRLYVFGHSMGGVMAPYLAKEVPIQGAIVYGTAVRTWLEYSLENTRRQAAIGGMNESDIADLVLAQTRLLSGFLVEKKTLGEVWEKHPELRDPNDPFMEPTRMFGRHVTFFHQLQDLNLSRAWAEADTNLLAIHGEFDAVSAELDHRLAVQIAGSREGRIATFEQLPKADHGFTIQGSELAGLTAMAQGDWDGSLPKLVLAWIEKVEAAENAGAEAKATTQ